MPHILHLIEVKAPQEKCFKAISTKEGFQGWWTTDTTLSENKFTFGFNNHKYVSVFKISESNSPEKISMKCTNGMSPNWQNSTLTIECKPAQNNTTKIYLMHDNFKNEDEEYGMCNTTWGKLMFHLKEYLETDKPNPFFT